MHGQCDAKPTFTFLAAQHYCPLASTKLYCLANRGMCVNNLPKVVTWQCTKQKSNQQPWVTSSVCYCYTTKPDSHMFTNS